MIPLSLFCLTLAGGQTVCIDPGHPSETSAGTRGRRATEVQVVWHVAEDLADRLRSDGFTVVLTKRREEEFVKNRRRAEIANQARAGLMLRLHCDAGAGTGFAVYYPATPGTVNGVTGPSAEVIRASREAATRFHAGMAGELSGALRDNGLKTDRDTTVGARQGALTGSIFSTVPVVLVEMVVLQNPHDENWILGEAGESKMVTALEAGVLKALR